MRSPARVWLTVGPLALAAGGGALAVVLTSGHEENRILVSIFGLLVGWSFLVAGLIARTRRPENRTGLLMLVVGFTFFAGALGDSNVSMLFTFGFAVGAVFIAALIHLMLAYPSGRLASRREVWLVVGGYTIALLANAVPMLFDSTPGGESCDECPDNALLITDSPTADAALSVVLEGLGFLVIGVVVVLLVRRWRRSSPAARRLLGPVLIAGGVSLAFFALTIVVFPLSETAANVIGIGFVAGFIATPFVFLWGILRSRLVRPDLAPLLAESSETPTLGETQDVLRAVMRDPSLELLYWVEEANAYFDVERRRRELPDLTSDLAWTRVDSETGPLAALVYDPVLCDEPEQVERVTAALRLRLEKDRSVRALRISEYRSRALLDAIPDTMFRLLRDGTILDVQSHDPENVVYPPEEMVGTSIYAIPADVIASETMDERRRLVRRAFETGEVQTQEYAVNMPNGTRRFAETRIVPSGENEFVMIVRDVTQERLTESRSEALLEALPDSVFRLTRDGRYLDFRARDAAHYSVDSASFLGTSIHDALPPAVVEGVMTAAERAFETGAMQTVEGELEYEGATVYAEARIMASGRDEFVMIVRDVTDRITQQRQIETQNQFLEAMGDATTGLLCNLHLDGRLGVDNVNLPLRELTGYAQYEVDGGYFWEVFVAPEDRADAERIVKEVVAGNDPGEQQSRWLKKDGGEFIVAWTCRPMPHVTGEEPKLLISGTDVTERVRHQEELEAERDYLSTVTDATPSVMCRIDTEGRLGKFGLNLSMQTLIGYAEGELAGQRFSEVISAPEDAATVERVIGAVAAGETPGEQETTWLTKDGRRVLVAWTCVPLPARGDERRLQISGTDVTERKQREDEQAALRRVAVAVASERRPEDVFQTVTEEAGRLLGGAAANMVRYDPDANEGIVVGYWQRADAVQDDTVIGRRIALKGGPVSVVRDTARAMRVEPDNPKPGYRERMQAERTSSVVTAPVLVSGRVWGAISVTLAEGSFPPETEDRIAQFSSLVATALANAEAREELHASRARIVEAGDAERRRLERNLHDGAQQRLVSLSLSLRLAQAKLRNDVHAADEILSSASVELALALEELRELARGIHPAVLTDRGLGPALESLADRTPLPVRFDALPDDRLPPPVEAAAFYVVSEAIANVTKYAEASAVSVRVAHENGYAVVEVADDGVGGADPQGGSGLRGLSDRVAALEGRLAIVSPPGAGTRIRAEIPVDF